MPETDFYDVFNGCIGYDNSKHVINWWSTIKKSKSL